MIRFGTAGNPQDFYDKKNKASEQMPKYLYEMGLNAYEYACSRGVRVSDEKIVKIREQAEKYDIFLSVHSPYYVSLSTTDNEKQLATIKYITDTMIVAQKLGAKKVVVHAGALLGQDRKKAVINSCELLQRTLEKVDQLGISNVTLCPETMGKINQLGDSQEIIQMCQVDTRLVPTIDFGHLYCRSLGRLNSYDTWKKELQMYIQELGYERMKHFHAHFSQMEFTQSGGEKRHVTFADKGFGPDFVNIARVLKELRLEPSVICESAGTQSFDALMMKKIYEEIEEESK